MKTQLRTLLFLALLLGPSAAFGQGVTTSSMTGFVFDSNGETLPGANVVAEHTPTGTTYGTATDAEGRFSLRNLRVGGPYTVTASFTGFQSADVEDIMLRLGVTFEQNLVLQEGTVQLDELSVEATAGSSGERAGANTQISTDDIENLPTLDRNLNDFLRLTPQSSSFGNGITFAGMNNRFNALYIDGAVNNDVFGLASSGTNGGQTGITPFSIDVLDQLQVVLSPYDVTYGGFAGGGINAVTKSGSNEFRGTAYYFVQNEDLVGKTNENLSDRLGVSREKVSDFTEEQFGFSLGGPIIKNKLFFFTNVELQRDATPRPFNTAEYTSVDGRASEADLNNLRNFLINTYGYDPGTFGNVSGDLDGTKVFGKLNWNINRDHKLTLRHQFTDAEQFNRFAGSSTRLNFSNNGIFFPSTTNSSALELNSTFGTRYANNLIVSYVRVRDNRSTLGDRFPWVSIRDTAGGSIRFGSEEFSTANQLDQDIVSITNNLDIFRGKHTITVGTHNEFYSIFNLFLRQNFGSYEFNSIDDFINNERPSAFTRTFAVDGSGAADFNAMQFGLYAQDQWRVNDQFTLTAGLRLDVPVISDDPTVDTFLRDTALPKMQAEYDVARDVTAGQAPDGQFMLSPRLGFSYDMRHDIVKQIRGGAGIFTSRIPFVWPGAMFTNNGVTAGGVRLNDLPDTFRFNPDPDGQPVNPNQVVPSGQVDLFTDDFKYPQMFRTNLATDIMLPGGVRASVEGLYTRTLNNITYTNVNSDPTVAFNFTGSPDDRPVFTGGRIDGTYDAVYVASNTSRGHTWNLSTTFEKSFDMGLSAMGAWSYGDSYSVTEGTSSQNSSQWRGQVNVNGRNDAAFGRSDFAAGHRVLLALSQKIDWGKASRQSTTISLFTNIQSGGPFSYIISGRSARNLNNESGSTSRNRSLVFVPASASEINLVDFTASDGSVVTAAEQWENLNRVINDDDNLKDRRGQYAEKNGSWLPYTAQFDISIRHDFGVDVAGKQHKLQVSADIFNVANLINSSWGTFYSAIGNFNYYNLYQFEGFEADGTTPRYTFRNGDDTGNDRFDIEGTPSRWRMQFGLRYIFN